MTNNTIADVLATARTRLAHSDSALLDAQILLAKVLQVGRSYFYAWPEKEISKENIQAFELLLHRREQGEPIAYIVQTQEFWSLSLRVAPSTLIPRPETELLVETVLELVSTPKAMGIDLGTGTGAIALALASEQPQWSLLGIDYSEQAVALAQSNQQQLAIENATFLQSSWLENVDKQWLGTCDFIVSNPPYIDENDPHLAQGDVRFEPLSALVAKNDGLQDIMDITAQAVDYLKVGGYLLFEHGFEQAESVRNILTMAGFVEAATLKDLAGLDRVTFAQRR
ncbi:MAG: peptide chain release factor N(5)-glutamine methyltransferase [Psychrobium sp.]|nr:peptide chain release factor N(5)-glutamine methyltransferase [Psychrobium sp.]